MRQGRESQPAGAVISDLRSIGKAAADLRDLKPQRIEADEVDQVKGAVAGPAGRAGIVAEGRLYAGLNR